jgi:predicted metal-dependent peptidase
MLPRRFDSCIQDFAKQFPLKQNTLGEEMSEIDDALHQPIVDENGQEKKENRFRPKELTDQEVRKLFVKATEKLTSTLNDFAFFDPIYAQVVENCNRVPTFQIPTMAVGPHKRGQIALYYNPIFTLQLAPTEVADVIRHECLHILLDHLARIRMSGLNPKIANLAFDMAINSFLKGLPDNLIYPELYGLENFKSAEFYYNALKRMAQNKKDDKGNDFDIDKLATVDDHGLWDDITDPQIVHEKCKSIAMKAREQVAKGRGTLPGNVVEQIDEIYKSVVDWRSELRAFVGRVVQYSRKPTRSRPNRRFGDLFPGKKKDSLTRILVATDTSGSVSRDELAEFGGEINGILRHVWCDLIQFDCALQGEPERIVKKMTEFNVKGRGGTDFAPVIDLALERQYDGLVIMTDGGAPFPPEPLGIKVIWILTKSGEHVNPPWGKKVVMDRKNNNF